MRNSWCSSAAPSRWAFSAFAEARSLPNGFSMTMRRKDFSPSSSSPPAASFSGIEPKKRGATAR